METKKIFILGAGSSIGHSKKLFPSIQDFFHKAKELGLDLKNEYGQVVGYAKNAMGTNVLTSKINIEELFTNVEIELERNSSPDFLAIRQQLLKLIQVVLIKLEESLVSKGGEYQNFIEKLGPSDTIITFNWDLLLDNLMKRKQILISYGSHDEDASLKSSLYWDFISNLTVFAEGTWRGISLHRPYQFWNPDSSFYLKAHGSIDWFYCSNESCSGARKVFPVLEPLKICYCSDCHEPLDLLLIPPILNKGYRQYPPIRRIWNIAAKEISSAEELIIWGYSLPPTDFYISWLLRQAREGDLKSLTIINPSVFNQKSGKVKVSTTFVRNFYNIFRDKVVKTDLHLYESFTDYCSAVDVLKKYDLGDIKDVYRGI